MTKPVEEKVHGLHSYTSNLLSFSNTCASASVSAGLIFFAGHALNEDFFSRYTEIESKYPGFDMASPETAPLVMTSKDAESYVTNHNLYGLTTDALLFTSNTLLSRVLDSFEYYMQSLIKIIILKRPSIMKPSRTQNGNGEFKIGISLIVDSMVKGPDGLTSAIVDDYIRSILSGPAYKRAIDFITNKVGSRRALIQAEELKILDALYRARNSITHEDGVIHEKEWLALGDLVRPDSKTRSVSHFDITCIAFKLCEIAFELEDLIRDGFYDEQWFSCSKEQIMEPLEEHYRIFSNFIRSHPFYASRSDLN